jgi:hypothetical protein
MLVHRKKSGSRFNPVDATLRPRVAAQDPECGENHTKDDATLLKLF